MVGNFRRMTDPETGGIWGKQLGELEAIEVVQASLNEAGFDAFVEQIPAAEWYARVFAAEIDFDLAVSWFAGYTDPAIVRRRLPRHDR